MVHSIIQFQKSLFRFYFSSIGQKLVVALTGLVMVGWLVGHLLGNLQFFAGSGADPSLTKINQYAAFLKANLALLWGVRALMLSVIVLHVVTVIQLSRKNQSARPDAYHTKKRTVSSIASNFMLVGGFIILAYIVYHLLHFTLGAVHGSLLDHHDLYQSMVNSFQNPLIVTFYLIGQIALGFHLFHGLQSTARTFGVSDANTLSMINVVGLATTLLITIGFSSIPLAVLFGFIS